MLDYAIRSTLLLALTGAAAWMLRERSAAWRHLVLLAGLVSLLALPAAKTVAPQWNAPVMMQSNSALSAGMRTVIEVTARRGGPRQTLPINWLFAVWLGGAAFLTIRLTRAQMLAARLVKRSAAGSEDGVVVSAETDIPIVCGLWNPVVVLPVDSTSWPAERRESVLRHERMHIARRDTISQALAQLACAVYWPQPFVWLAASALRKSCEQACDDGVLAQGTRPSAYAQHLMEIARGLPMHAAGAPAAFEGGIAMTRTNLLEQRIAALLNPNRDRRQAGASFAAGVAALAVTLVIGLAAIRTPLMAQSGKLAGVVRDPSGAVIPKARIDVRTSVAAGKVDKPVHEIVYANAAGEFSLDSLADGTYDIMISAPGFARQEHQAVLFDSANPKQMPVTLNIGGIHERIRVQGDGVSADKLAAEAAASRAAAAASPAGLARIVSDAPGGGQTPPTRIRIGGNVQAANLVHKVTPLYPVGAKLDGVEGTVIYKAVIGKDGSIMSLEQVNKLVDTRLAEAATEAVKQWQYKPTLLNGDPVEVVTEIEVNFTLMR